MQHARRKGTVALPRTVPTTFYGLPVQDTDLNRRRAEEPVHLEAVNLDLVLLHELLAQEEVTDILPLVSLKLNYFAEFGILHDGTVAAKLLLQCLEHLVVIVPTQKGQDRKNRR